MNSVSDDVTVPMFTLVSFEYRFDSPNWDVDEWVQDVSVYIAVPLKKTRKIKARARQEIL